MVPNPESNYYIDCPECGSAATLMNIVKHGRCNGYPDQDEEETDLDEGTFDWTAKFHLELGYRSDPAETSSEGIRASPLTRPRPRRSSRRPRNRRVRTEQ